MKSYRLNDLVEVRVNAPSSYIEFFDNEYARISRPPSSSRVPSITLTVVDRIPPGGVREMNFKRIFTFRYAVREMETAHPEIIFERHWLDRLYLTPLGAFIQGQLLEPVMYLKPLECGILFMHAAGVSRDGRGYVFPAHGGTGKTTLALSLTQNGFQLLGDDLLMIEASSGRVYPYARPLHLFTYNLTTMKVPFALESAIRFKDLVRMALNFVTGERFLIATRAHVEDLMSVQFGGRCDLARMIFLRRDGAVGKSQLRTVIARREAALAIIDSADLNDSLYANIADEDEIRQLEIDVVMKLLEQISQIEFIKPREMDETSRIRFSRTLTDIDASSKDVPV